MPVSTRSEWNLARTFNYDEMVNQEYAKVRRLYDNLGLSDRTMIEHFNGPHTIHVVGTFCFLEEMLRLR